ncbi:phosphotransferase [Actinoplanes teichomyceticus]|uniref:Aminoglycoside phosphotransferase (APT) family kinase protein n=1 Tax=Actinoplanes teichomyceticus TaxID=1867 RepID=A0A561VKM9_ACTTI|nr:phosphotransferase [Actinoplanes teichomyceticus]TWG12185.1 aminoglycoside phosphotransferase (APT) family kinase protein [Actinoplanes teichomyceticus]GIF14118.1 putative phosphotransferase [Actinoplanes teichomyceticus]
MTVRTATARSLIAAQFPRWRALPVRRVAGQGTVNAVFRLGDRLCARFPLQDEDVVAEAAAARELCGATRFATPEPVAIGEPGPGFERRWAVQTWLEGTVTTPDSHASAEVFARDLAELVHGVRALDTRGRTFAGRGRGGDLRGQDEWMATCLRRSEGLLDVPPLRRLWAGLRELPREAPDVMCHRDLIPGNLLATGDRLTGVLDVGGLGPCDPALDLVCAWHLLGPAARRVLRAELGCDDLTWERGRAWAFVQSMGLVWYYERRNPAMARLGRSTLARISSPGR